MTSDELPPKDGTKTSAVSPEGDRELLTETNYTKRVSQVHDKLNAVSPSFCLAKWYNVSLHLTTGMTHSCYHPPAHKVPLESLADEPSRLHNTDHKRAQREMMLKGERPKECQYCWNIEDSDGGGKHLSDRAYRSEDVFEPGLVEEAVRLGSSGNPDPRYVEVNFNQACNLRCSYCSPHLSSSWAQEVRELGPYKLIEGLHNDVGGLKNELSIMPSGARDNEYVEAFWKWWPTMVEKLRHFRMTGGEPLLDRNSFRIFEEVIKKPRPELEIAITSNCSPPAELWEKFMKYLTVMTHEAAIKQFSLYCSLDAWGPQAEYIRHGLRFSELEKNIDDYLRRGKRHFLTFIVTFNNLSVVGWRRYLEAILDLRLRHYRGTEFIRFDTPMLRAPAWMSLQILPPSYQALMQDALSFMEDNLDRSGSAWTGFQDFEVARMRRLIAWMQEAQNPHQLMKNRANFYLYFSQHDARRGTNFLESFPEMADFWQLCENSMAYFSVKGLSPKSR